MYLGVVYYLALFLEISLKSEVYPMQTIVKETLIVFSISLIRFFDLGNFCQNMIKYLQIVYNRLEFLFEKKEPQTKYEKSRKRP